MGILTQHITTEPEPVAQRAREGGPCAAAGPRRDHHALHAEESRRSGSATMDELVNALIADLSRHRGRRHEHVHGGVPRRPSAQHPVATPQTGMHAAPGAYTPTMGVGPPPGAGGYAMPSGGQLAAEPVDGAGRRGLRVGRLRRERRAWCRAQARRAAGPRDRDPRGARRWWRHRGVRGPQQQEGRIHRQREPGLAGREQRPGLGLHGAPGGPMAARSTARRPRSRWMRARPRSRSMRPRRR